MAVEEAMELTHMLREALIRPASRSTVARVVGQGETAATDAAQLADVGSLP
jgi:hypothetical protein